MTQPDTTTDAPDPRGAAAADAVPDRADRVMDDPAEHDSTTLPELDAVRFDSDLPSVSRPRQDVLIGSADPMGITTLDDAPEVIGAGSGAVGRPRLGDRVFSGLATGSGVFVIVLVALVGIFLLIQAVPAIKNDTGNFFGHQWNVSAGRSDFGITGLLFATVIASAIAMLIAVPISIGIALFMTQYAPARLTGPIGYVIDLLAAIPSIIYGIWGFTVLSDYLRPVQRGLYHLGGFPIFKDQGFLTGSIFDGGVVLAIMVLPIVTAIARDVFARTPRQNVEAALALGATRWETIRLSVLPYGRAGVISGAMLGLGRALGETIAVTLILSAPPASAPLHASIFNGGETFASKIANSSGEFGNNPGPFIAAGLVLFVLTFVVNAIARSIVNRRKEFTA